GLLPAHKARLVASSGVDTSRFVSSNSKDRLSTTVSFVGRLVWQKGLREFAEMAMRLKPRFPDVRYVVGGEFDPTHPDAVPEEWVRDMVAAEVFEFVGYVSD